MSYSLKLALKYLKNIEYMDIHTLGYCLIVLRDNCLNLDTYKALDYFIKYLWSINGKI